MNTISLTCNGKPMRFVAPSKWDEVSARELIRWAAVAYSDVTEGDRVRLALLIMYNFPAKIFAKLSEQYRVQVAPTIGFLFQENKLTRWVYPRFRIGFRRFYGPADKLTNVSANEFFNYTEVLYQQWILHRNPEVLNALCAVLYRQRRKDVVTDDLRVGLTDAGIALRAKRFEALHISVKLAILMNYEGCRGFIINQFPAVFKSSGKLQHNKTPADLVLALSDGPFGNYNETRHANLYKFLQHMVRTIEHAEELKNR